jgi:uncharacterized protein with HEPN domain
VTYREAQRLADIQAAIDAIRSHLQRGDLSDGLVFDAVRIRLLEIGEAVKALPAEMLRSQPAIPWAQIARLRDRLAHRYFDTDHAVLHATVDNDLPELERAVQALAETLPVEEQGSERPRPSPPQLDLEEAAGARAQRLVDVVVQVERGQDQPVGRRTTRLAAGVRDHAVRPVAGLPPA